MGQAGGERGLTRARGAGQALVANNTGFSGFKGQEPVLHVRPQGALCRAFGMKNEVQASALGLT